MNVLVNGKAMELPGPISVAALIRHLGLEKQACAAEVNQHLVPRREHDSAMVEEGDRVELVTLVGGG